MSNDKTETEAAASLGASIAAFQKCDDTPFVVVPQGYQVEDLSRLLKLPSRKTGKFTMHDAESFIEFVKADRSESTRIYGSYEPPAFKAVFDDHGLGAAGWRQHAVTYTCPHSDEWKTWTGTNKRQMTQEAFAQFIEDNAPDCVAPDSATMIEISRTLEAKKKVNFASAIRLSNGQSELTYEEQISGTASKGKLALPEVFTIGVPVLRGGPRYSIEARFRYRIGDGGNLTLWYDLLRTHKIAEAAVEEVWKLIAEALGARIFNGA